MMSMVASGSFPKTNYGASLNSFQFLFKSLITFEEKDPDSTVKQNVWHLM